LTGVRERWGCGRPTERSLDALLHYRDGCGSLLYLGGNGFYWRVAVDDAGTVEIRRGEGGIRAWAALSSIAAALLVPRRCTAGVSGAAFARGRFYHP